MSSPSRLYRRVGQPGPLLAVTAGDEALGDQVTAIDIHRGSDSLSVYQPSIITVHTPRSDLPSLGGRSLDVRLTQDTCDHLADLTGLDGSHFEWRFNGRAGGITWDDAGDGRGWLGSWRGRGITINGAGWGSVLENAPGTWTPQQGATVRAGAFALLEPAWEPRVELEWYGTASDTWGAPEDEDGHEPLTAADMLSLLQDRLYGVADSRSGRVRVSPLARLEERINEPADPYRSLPLARRHVLAPSQWQTPSTHPVAYRVLITNPDGSTQLHGSNQTGAHKVTDLDWSDLIAHTDQWRRVIGLAWATRPGAWTLPSLTARVDLLLASASSYDRGLGGYLLTLNPGDPIALADDWPHPINGVHLVTSLTERITPDAWTIEMGLTPSMSVAGGERLPVKPQIWAQAGTRTWDDAGTNTWRQGVPA